MMQNNRGCPTTFQSTAASVNLKLSLESTSRETVHGQWFADSLIIRLYNEGPTTAFTRTVVAHRCTILPQVLDLGCNAVLAYQQDFDVEGDSGIVARAYGTACVIQRRESDKTNSLTRQVPIAALERSLHSRGTPNMMLLMQIFKR